MPADLAHIRQVMAEADCLYTEAEVEAAIDRVAAAINDQLAERNPVVFCVMNGGLIFSGKLLPKLDFPLELSYLHATRYRNETSGGELWAENSAGGGAVFSFTLSAISRKNEPSRRTSGFTYPARAVMRGAW